MQIISRTAGVVALISALLGCNALSRSTPQPFRVNGAVDFLVVACHERHRAIITETSREFVGCEVKRSGPRGQFSLTQPKSLMGAHPVTYLTISKPGFQLLEEQLDKGPNRDPISLTRATDYREELAAIQAFDRATYPFENRFDQAQRKLVDAHSADRQSYLETHYPADIAADKERAAHQSFSRRPSLGKIVLALAALPGGGLAAVTPAGKGRQLVIVDSQQKQVGRAALADSRAIAAMTRQADSLVLYDKGALHRFDFAGKPLDRVALAPAPASHEPVFGLAVLPDGFVVGLGLSLAMDGTRKPCRLRHYDRTGKLLAERDLSVMTEISRIFSSPQGAVLVVGKLAGDYDYDLRVVDMKKEGMPQGIVRLRDWTASPEILVKGFGTAIPSRDGIIAYAPDLVPVKDNRPGSGGAQQMLVRLSWEGQVVSTHDVSDGTVRELTFGEPLGDRLVFSFAKELYELDGAKLPSE